MIKAAIFLMLPSHASGQWLALDGIIDVVEERSLDDRVRSKS